MSSFSGLKMRPIWLQATLMFMAYYLLIFLTLYIRFENVPNYISTFDYFSNIWQIITSTPSFHDIITIAMQEWVMEVGYMNYSFGKGISEWSVSFLPIKMLAIYFSFFAVALAVGLWKEHKTQTKTSTRAKCAVASAGVGSFFMALSCTTLSWIVCCATPSWIISLAILGISPAVALALEPLGNSVLIAAIVMLTISGVLIIQASRKLAIKE